MDARRGVDLPFGPAKAGGGLGAIAAPNIGIGTSYAQVIAEVSKLGAVGAAERLSQSTKTVLQPSLGQLFKATCAVDTLKPEEVLGDGGMVVTAVFVEPRQGGRA